MPDHSAASAILAFLTNASIPHSAPESADFGRFQSSITGRHDESTPCVIVRPQTHEHVAAVVQQCVASSVPVVVRGGGHDMFGRFTAPGAACIDLRDINAVHVSPDTRTARVGGGVTGGRLVEVLEKEHGLTVPVGSCDQVGYAGWCLVGGFGLYTDSYGLGCDQIVGAKVVNAQGKLVDADEGMLAGLRGGGGNMGVVVELEVKTYPLKKIHAGLLFYESSDIQSTVTTFFTNYQAMMDEHKHLPRQLHLRPALITMPPPQGRTMTCWFAWNDAPCKESYHWLHRVRRLAPPMRGDVMPSPAPVAATYPSDLLRATSAGLPPQMFGRCQSVSFRRLSRPIIDCLGSTAASMPARSVAGLNFHTQGPDSPSCCGFSSSGAAAAAAAAVPSSVCPYREPMLLMEILALTANEAGAEAMSDWAVDVRSSLMRFPDTMSKTYIATSAPEVTDINVTYSQKLPELRRLKKEYDPENVFMHAVPRIG